MKRWARNICVVLWLIPNVSGCGTESATEPTLPERSLVDHRAWVPVPRDESPFVVPQDARACPLGEKARYEELGGEPTFAIETQGCDYATVAQPLRARLDAGELISLRFWNFRLSSPAGSVAHAVLQIDDTLVWEKEIPIPSPSGLTSIEWTVPRDFPQGVLIYFHVKNHGQNEYNLVEGTAGGVP